MEVDVISLDMIGDLVIGSTSPSNIALRTSEKFMLIS